ncbi:hypothetical protein [Streptomyces sp. NPDC001744]|uniref:hypothetical protein n=1 Tax=Streptomyces sp. NPDC001744 TaxID=3364606 RepID=UPI0036AEBB81
MPQIDTPTDTVPAATLYEWQRRAQRHLADLIEHGAKNGLPPLGWSLATNGNLIGAADSLSYTPEQQRAAVKQWADHVGVPVDTDHVNGREELYAGWKDDDRRTRGCFRATIFVHREGA